MGIDETHQSYRRKLISMGLTRGTVLMVRNVAPFGDPVHISVRDFDVSLRRDEADALILEMLDEDPADYGFHPPRGGWGRRPHGGPGRGLGWWMPRRGRRLHRGPGPAPGRGPGRGR